MKGTSEFRRLLREEPVVAAGVFDSFSARIAESVGFRAVYCTGFGMEATQLGAPDIGLITMTEVLQHVGHIANAVRVPVLCDVDTGWGGVTNVTRTVREFERIGVAGFHMEDQVFPKKCPALEGRRLLPRDEAVAKVKAACAARTDPDFLIIARSDADEVSFNELIARCNLYLDAGADIVMPYLTKINGVRSRELAPRERMEWHQRLGRAVKGPMLTTSIIPGYTVRDMAEAGYKVLLLPLLALRAAAGAMKAALSEALLNATAEGYFRTHASEFDDPWAFFQLLGIDRWLEIERRHFPAAVPVV